METNAFHTICSSLNQVELDYFIHLIKNNKQEIVYSILQEDFKGDDVDDFISQIEKFHLQDIDKVKVIQNTLNMSDEELVDIAEAILRIKRN